MATVTRENIGLLNEKLTVKVAQGDYLPSFEKAIRDYTRKANIPGFRKGMVPVGMVKKMYGSSVFADEVIKSVEKGLTDYMESEKIDIFAQPLPLPEPPPSMNMNEPAEYAFSFEIGLKPEFAIPDLATLPLTRYAVTVSEDMISKEVNIMRTELGTYEPLEAVTSVENKLDVTFTAVKAEGDDTLPDEKQDYLSVHEFTPEFSEQLMGKLTGDVLRVVVKRDIGEKSRERIVRTLGLVTADAEWEYDMLIEKISERKEAELNGDFYGKVFPGNEISSEAEFHDQVKQQLQRSFDAQSRNQLIDQIYHALLQDTHIEFPADFLKRWIVTSSKTPKTPEEAEQEFPKFSNQLKWTLIMEKLTEEQAIDVSQEEIRNSGREQLMSYMRGQVQDDNQPWINDYLDRMMKDKKFVEDSYHRVRTEKLFNWLESQVHPVETAISETDFNQLQHQHHDHDHDHDHD